MKKRVGLFLVCMIFVISFINIFYTFETVKASGNILYVGGTGPGNYSSIQSAINSASNGDTIYVYYKSGGYRDILTINKEISIIGISSFRSLIFMDSTSYSGPAVTITANNVKLEHLEVENDWWNDAYVEGIYLNSCSNCKFEDLKIDDCYNYGLYFDYSSNSIVKNCIIYSYTNGIILRNSDNNHIYNNSIGTIAEHDAKEIYLHTYSSYNLIENNIFISTMGPGIYLDNVYYNIIRNNNFSSTRPGMIINNCHDNIINYNYISINVWGYKGIEVYSSYSNEISMNWIHASHDSIHFENCDANRIFGNDISSENINGGYDFYLDSSSNDNLIFHNNFINNPMVYDQGSNYWSNITINQGNYWINFDEPSEGAYDIDENGIVDSPYTISGGSNQDLYPLMYPFEYYNNSIVYVNDDYDNTTIGWNVTRFNVIQDGIDAVAENGTVYVYNGTYKEKITIQNSKLGISLLGENKFTTIIDCLHQPEVIYVYADNVNISGFTLKNATDDGINLHSKYNTISNNILVSNNNGIVIALNYHYNKILNNTIDALHYGIHTDCSNGNIIIGNDISNCTIRGMYLYGTSNNDSVYHNNFYNNIENIGSGGYINYMDNGYPSGGNYWDDYTGTDNYHGPNQDIPGADGIGDTPYLINGASYKDNYPLMNPWGLSPPYIVFVDYEYNVSTPGWAYDHFDNIQDGIDSVAENGTVFVFNGTYYENVVVNKTINLNGENRDSTIIDGVGTVDVVHISVNYVNISGFSIQNSGDQAGAGVNPFDAGIEINSNYCRINDNKIINNSAFGIGLRNSNNNTITNNIIGYNGFRINGADGVRLEYSNNNVFSNNKIIYNGRHGFLIWASGNNSILNNSIVSQDDYGVYIHNSIFDPGSNNNTIVNNLFEKNNYGIYIYINSNWSKIFHNNFINNTQNAYDDETNIWDNGYPSGGNYWSDYTGTDANGDGIGDIPYNISGGINQDLYPLMYPITSPPVFVWVDDDFNSTVPGWQIDHFGVIQDGIDVVAVNGTVYVYNGTYYENVVINKSICLVGEDKNITIIDGDEFGDVIYVSADFVNITRFTIQNSGDIINDIGIEIVSNLNTISGNLILNNRLGVRLDHSNNNTLFNNIISLNDDEGIELWHSSFNIISDNIMINNSHGIEIHFSSNNNIVFENIILSSSDQGIDVSSSNNNNIFSNNISLNNAGLHFEDSSNNNTVSENTINDNLYYGIYFDDFSCINNIIYHNNLFNNLPQNAHDDMTNFWYNSSIHEGNYWDNYNGTDVDGDGIGDTPYNISGGSNQDLYPLMTPYGPPCAIITFTTNQSTVFFNSTSSYDYDGTIESYYWDFGDDYYTTVANPTHTYYNNGDYTVTLKVTDNDGNNHTTYLVLRAHNNNMVNGWNLITIPVENGWNASDLVSNVSGCMYVVKWDSIAQEFWIYVPGFPAFDFPLIPGCGYFVEMNTSNNLSMVGYPVSSVNVTLKVGVNLIGWYQAQNTTASSILQNISNCSSIIKWDPLVQDYWLYLPGFPAFDFVVSQGMGLFVEVDQESYWHGEG